MKTRKDYYNDYPINEDHEDMIALTKLAFLAVIAILTTIITIW